MQFVSLKCLECKVCMLENICEIKVVPTYIDRSKVLNDTIQGAKAKIAPPKND